MVGLHFNDGWWTEVVHVTTQHLVNGAKDCWSKVLPSALRVSRCLPQIVLQTVLFFCPILAQFCCNLFFPFGRSFLFSAMTAYVPVRYILYIIYIFPLMCPTSEGGGRGRRVHGHRRYLSDVISKYAPVVENFLFFGQFWRWKSSPSFIFATLYTHIPMHRQIFYTTLEKLNICKIYYIYSSNLYHMYIYMYVIFVIIALLDK